MMNIDEFDNIRVQNNRGVIFLKTKSACGRHIDHGGWERTRHSHILQVYRHPTSIQTPYKYTDTPQVYRHPTGIQYPEYKSRHSNTSPGTQIQVQTAKYKSRHPKHKSRHLKYNI